jgi:HAD superfamily hydrolase (TIGR01509 family)
MLGVNESGVHAALVKETGTTVSQLDLSRRKWAHYELHAAAIRSRGDVAKVVADLAARGIPMAVVSNSTADEVAIALNTTGLDRILTTTVSIADVLRGKPDPEGYLLGARRIGAIAAECLVVEDSPVGAAAGLAAGMRVIFHPQAGVIPEASAGVGTHYLPPDGALGPLITHALNTGDLP